MTATTRQRLEDARRTRIERHWPRYQWDGSGRSRWGGWDWRIYLYLVICGLLFSGTILESAVSADGKREPWWPFGLLAESLAGRILLLLLMLANGWLMDRNLADRTPGERLVQPWLRWLRRALVSIPVVGLYAIPAWRWVIQRQPSWAFRTSARARIHLITPSTPMAGSLPRLRAWSRMLRRRQGQSLPALVLWLIACQVAPWTALLSWATTTPSLSAADGTALFALTIVCRLLAFLGGLQFGAIRARQTRVVGWRAAAVQLAPLFFLFPFPFFIPGLFLWTIWAGEDSETFVGRSYSNKSRPHAPIPLPRSSSLRRALRSLSQGKRELDGVLNDLLPGTFENGQTRNQQLAFYRLKTFALIFDAAALAWLLAPVLRFDSLNLVIPFLVLAALGAVVELSFLVLRVTGWLLRRVTVYEPYGRSLMLSQLALAAGLLFGACLAEEQATTAGCVLMVVGLGTAIGSTLLLAPLSFLLMLPGRQTFVMLAWAGLSFELFAAGAVMRAQPELAPPFLHFFKLAVELTPVWSLALFLGLKSWLLHPFELGHLFDRRLPGKTRAVLAAVALTASIPLGGITIPFWIYVHHRLWPRDEKLLWNLKKTGMAWG